MKPFSGELPEDAWYHGNEKDIERNHKKTLEKISTQYSIILKLDQNRMGWIDNDIKNYHNKKLYKPSTWSRIEQFRYLETLYGIKPDLFPKISEREFKGMRKSFYYNQPIVATLPITTY